MAKSLQEQLMQAGLVDSKKAKSIKQEKRKATKQAPKPKKSEKVDTAAEMAARRREEQQARDRARAQQDSVLRKRQECTAQVRQMVETNRVKHGQEAGLREDAEVPFQFVDQRKVKKIRVDRAQQGALQRGQLAIVTSKGRYELVPAETAQRIIDREQALNVLLAELQIDPIASSVLLFNKQSGLRPEDAKTDASSDDNDDPYADYQIPDDLMW
ncbi:DUF2058 domain-containing protein [Allohahella sp. A8]|uniref:DUF2058 domain-containing protein n=1 Tax=Allohahella sp. A8 TaxID=3141461 RepID=UPI00267F5ADA